jgi:hypothetical protein
MLDQDALTKLLNESRVTCKKCGGSANFGYDYLFLSCGCIVHPKCLRQHFLEEKVENESGKSPILSLYDCVSHFEPVSLDIVRMLLRQEEMAALSARCLKQIIRGI